MNPDSLLAGSIFQNLTPPSLDAFLSLIKKKVYHYFPEGDPRMIASCLSSDDLLSRMRLLREEIKGESQILDSFLPVWSELGFDLKEIFLDAIRIRCVPDRFHEDQKASSIGFIHRDPWYANPQCQLNFWIPVFDVEEGTGFRVFPSYFNKAIPNNSEFFDYSEWMALGGFQSVRVPIGKSQFFPSPLEIPIETKPVDVFGKEGQLAAFSSHHLHGTSPNISGKSRFSLEVRFVLLSHLEQKIGPPKIDNFSKGSTLSHMYDLFTKRAVSEFLIKHYEDGFVHS